MVYLKRVWYKVLIIVCVFISLVLLQVTPTGAENITWTARNSGTDNALWGIMWDGSRFVTVGEQQIILTSPDGGAWSVRHLEESTDKLSAITFYYRYVTVGDGGAILTSTNLSTWAPHSTGYSDNLTGVIWSGNQFVAVGSDVMVSNIGLNWHKITTGTSAYGVAWNGSMLVKVAGNGAAFTSPSGIVWSQEVTGTDQTLKAVTWGDGKFVAVGGSGTVITSPDGENWSSQPPVVSSELHDVTWTGSRYVAVGNSGTILLSSDGENWTLQNSGTIKNLYAVASDGAPGSETVVVTGESGTVLTAVLPPPPPAVFTVERIYGGNRYQTAVEISKEGWNSANTVVLARGDHYADALAGVPLAYQLDAPILLTPTTSLSIDTQLEIQRLGASKVIILGGYNAVSSQVDQALTATGLTVDRIEGYNRYATAALIAEELAPTGASTVVLAYGHNFPDALAAAAYAAQNGYPILLTEKDNLPAVTTQALNSLNPDNVIIVGGTAVISDDVKLQLPYTATRVFGNNRYSTALALANHFNPTAHVRFIATGLSFPDAITGAVLAAKKSSGILLVGHTVPAGLNSHLYHNNITKAIVFGGPSAVSIDLIEAINPNP